MRPGLKSLVALSLLTVAGCERTPRAPVKLRSDYAVRIEALLPGNWDLNESNGQIVISRKEAITAYSCVSLDISLINRLDRMKEEIERHGSKEEYKIRLRITPKVEFAEYSRLMTTNEQIRVTKGTVIKNRDFFEHDAMRSFDPNYRELPEYYDDHSSIYLETTLFPWDCLYPNEAARECEGVLASLDSLFKSYRPSPRSWNLAWPTTIVPPPSPVPLSSGGALKQRPCP